MTYIIAAFVPDELVTDHDSCVLTFGFKEMFDSADYEIFFADDPLGECDYAYSVDIDANAGVVAEGTPAEEEPIAAEELTLGQAYQTNDYEVTINGFSFGAKAEVVLSSGSITSKSVATADAGSTFILIDSTVKYLGTETISLRDTKPFSAYALYDDTYTYEEHFTFVGNKEIAPLQTQTQVLPVGIPQELESDDGPLSVFITIGDSVYQYVIR